MAAEFFQPFLCPPSFLAVIDSLSNLSVRIPEFLQRGETADLTCSYNLGGDTLYSVKWYKAKSIDTYVINKLFQFF